MIALLAADMAMAGIESVIPVDEVIDAMASVGHSMSATLRETAFWADCRHYRPRLR